MILKTISLRVGALVIGGLAIMIGLSILAYNFYMNQALDRIVLGYGLQTPPLQEWNTSSSYSKVASDRRVRKALRQVTAYNVGDSSQTSVSPCISASGENICVAVNKGEKRCAANFVKLGTLLHIQDYGLCRVTDRMHRRYKNRVDIALPAGEKQTARRFGVQQLLVTELSPASNFRKSSPLVSPCKKPRGQKNLHKEVKARAGKKKLLEGKGKQTLMAQMGSSGISSRAQE
jgi:3D (Asp-Asp-Asp) domain-containing protein